MPQEKKLTQQQVIALERDLAKFATMMDSAVRIPFTKQGIGADAAFYKAKQIGVPQHKLTPVIKLAVVDAVVGFVPVVGTIFDIFIRPSRKALDVVHTHIREEYAIQSDIHVVHPYLHEKLEKKQQQSAFWRNPVVSWLWLHIPDLLGAFVLLLIGFAVWWGASYLWGLYQTM
ncbi:DUF4112 domain-containing protein [Acinetobacter baumannii]|uniref:DUF4112 domain-containing protein n=1 Tax=Acinetobacter baumannii TaxID=470 RepID=UPI000DA6864D|nr:DUF4112 domain-containing protein [Acinetobacter baumannii]